jgi:DNA-binding LacI/PurR family transcriptional regulator
MPSVSQIARRAGVSKSTVSLVLNNRPNVTEATRRRVLQSLEDLRRESSSPAPSPHEVVNVLLIHPATLRSSQVFRELLQGVQSGIEHTKARLTLAVNQSPLESNHATHVLLHDRALKPDGVLVIGAQRDDPILGEIRTEKLPCVLLARQDVPADMSAVGMDNVGGARQAIEYLIALGHRRIAFLGGDPAYDYTHLRQQGYREALRAAQGEDELIFLGDGEQAARAFLNARTRATAIIFVNDEHALRAIPVLRAARVNIPKDLSVVSFDDTDEAVKHSPPLTSVAIPRTQIGYWAARVLVDIIRHPDLQTTRLLLRTRLSVRQSCAAIK